MKRLLSIVAMLGLVGLGMNLSAQQTPSSQSSQSSSSSSSQTPSSQQPDNSTQTPSSQQPDNSSMPQSSQTSTPSSQQSAKSFEGKIQKSGDKLVLQDSASGTSYQLDDQDKAKQFEGKNVKVTGTVDSASNTLHVIDITQASEGKY
jgi:hypothetical protein